ncbi:MAG: 2-isopropylmalate synthase [Armatimonadetes bacterium]|nr:2-isopropylmalate synthase [Armatimonadota bacterium]
MSGRVFIFDTTLRDGEQSPGFSMNAQEKLEMARQLARLRVDVIEAGFPISSPGDLEAAQLVAREVEGPAIAGLARANRKDIEAAWEGVRMAERPRIHTFIATSPIHMQKKLRMTPEQVLEAAVDAVRFARSLTDDVEFSAEDATRSDVEFLCRIFEAAVKAGATTINVPDTVGYATPEEFGNLIRTLMERVPGMDKVIVSVHCHNDLGLATANTLAGLRAGARQVEGTINGIGERAGNVALEEVIMALQTRRDGLGLATHADATQIYRTSRLLCAITGIEVQPNKAIVGENAFAHEAGIHQHGVLADRATYEIMTPESIGLPTNKLVMGKHSGRHAFRKVLDDLGYKLTEEEVNRAFSRFKQLADRKKRVEVDDIMALVEEEVSAPPDIYRLEHFHVATGTGLVPVATVVLNRGEQTHTAVSNGDGPVDALFAAINKIVGLSPQLVDYTIRAVTGGSDALGESITKIREGNNLAVGRGNSTDILEASVRAYLAAINKLLDRQRTGMAVGPAPAGVKTGASTH